MRRARDKLEGGIPLSLEGGGVGAGSRGRTRGVASG